MIHCRQAKPGDYVVEKSDDCYYTKGMNVTLRLDGDYVHIWDRETSVDKSHYYSNVPDIWLALIESEKMNAETQIVKDEMAKDLGFWREELKNLHSYTAGQKLRKGVVNMYMLPMPYFELWKVTLNKVDWDLLADYILGSPGKVAGKAARDIRDELSTEDQADFNAELEVILLKDAPPGKYIVVTGHSDVCRVGDIIVVEGTSRWAGPP